MMECKQITRPVGLLEAVERIEGLCDRGAVYRRSGIRPNNFFITLESGNGQTALLSFMADMFLEHGVCNFGGLDTFLEYKLDGTMAQMKNIFFEIKTSAVFTNFFEGILAFDISALAASLHEKQTEYFISEAAKCADFATVVFFASPNIKNIQALIDKVSESVHNLEFISVNPYTADELTEIAIRGIEEKGVQITCEDKAYEVVNNIILSLGIEKAKETERLVNTAVRNADCDGFALKLDPSKLEEVFSNCFEKVKGKTK